MRREIPIYDISSLKAFKKDDFLISRFGVYSQDHQHLHHPHRHNFYHIVLFTEGSGTHAIDFENFPVRPWQIYFMIPGQVHSWSFEGHVDGFVVNFSDTYFQSFLLLTEYLSKFSFFSGQAADSVIDIPEGYQQEIKSLFEKILVTAHGQLSLGDDHVRALLLDAFFTISGLVVKPAHQGTPAYNYTLLRNFQQLIDKNFKTMRLPREYAELLYITPNHLNALCNDQMGISAGELIRNRVILEAKRLLVSLDLTITQISQSLNFSDNSYFTKFFKKYAGLTPEEFRKKH